MMKSFRFVFRLGVVFLFIPCFGLYVLLVKRGSCWERRRQAAKLTRRWAQIISRIINLKVKVVSGTPADSGGLIVSNHQTYLDILVCAGLFPIRFASKAELTKNIAGPFFSQNEPIWIDRKSRLSAKKAAEEMVETLEHHISLLVYPEGTCSDGKTMLPFKSTSFEAVLQQGGGIRPMLIKYTPDPADGNGGPVNWFGDEPLLSNLRRMLGLRSLTAQVKILPEISVLPGEDRKALAQRVRDIMVQEYEVFQ